MSGPDPTTPRPDTAWFTRDRFGMFIHFGLYSQAARHEWVKSREQMTDEQYQRYFDTFDSDRFDAVALARAARALGARYVVFTTKHHDGFCLWNSHLTGYTAPKACGRDLVREYVDAVRSEGLKVGFYHSLLDWHHPDFTIDYYHPDRGRDVAALNAGRDMDRYRDYLHAQVHELLTEYGRIDLLFYDFTYPGTGWSTPLPDGHPDFRPDPAGLAGKSAADWDAERLLTMTRELQPGIVVNNRLGLPGDYVTPEQQQPDRPLEVDGHRVVWEACHTTNGSWGYYRDDAEYKDPELLVRLLIDSVANDGNLILNVGPDGRGQLGAPDQRILAEVGDWVTRHGRAIHGAGPAEFRAPSQCVYTQRGDRLYVHLLSWPLTYVHLPNLAGRVRYAQLLNDGSELPLRVLAEEHDSPVAPMPRPPGTLSVQLPIHRPDVLVPVVELFLDRG